MSDLEISFLALSIPIFSTLSEGFSNTCGICDMGKECRSDVSTFEFYL